MHRTQNPTGPAADTDNGPVVTPADVLRGAARYLEIHGWTQTSYYTRDTTPFPPACALGAIGMAAHGQLIVIPTDYGPGVSDCRAAIDYFTAYLNDLGITATATDDWSTVPVGPIEWNDRDDQNAENVIATLRVAADEYNWQHATEEQLETYAEGELDNDRIPTREGFLAWRAAHR